MDLYLDSKEAEHLTRLLEHRLEDLRREIHHTDSRTFRTSLKAEEVLMEGILGRLKHPALIGI